MSGEIDMQEALRQHYALSDACFVGVMRAASKDPELAKTGALTKALSARGEAAWRMARYYALDNSEGDDGDREIIIRIEDA